MSGVDARRKMLNQNEPMTSRTLALETSPSLRQATPASEIRPARSGPSLLRRARGSLLHGLNVAVLVLLVGVLLVAGCLETLSSKLEDLESR